MAKKAVATLHTGKTDGRAYTFDEQMVRNEEVNDFFKN